MFCPFRFPIFGFHTIFFHYFHIERDLSPKVSHEQCWLHGQPASQKSLILVLLTLDVRLDFPVYVLMFVCLFICLFVCCVCLATVQVTLLLFARHGTLTHTDISMRWDLEALAWNQIVTLFLSSRQMRKRCFVCFFFFEHLLALYLLLRGLLSSWTDLIPIWFVGLSILV
jgi:hypothetical protein